MLLAALLPLRAACCSVPVFRYALEHWKPDTCQAVVFHRGPLGEDSQKAAHDLSPAGLAGELRANVTLRLVDLDQSPAAEWQELWRRQEGASLPWLVVRFPPGTSRAETLWAGPLNKDAVQRLLDSPARREIARRISAGESAVWVLVESGDRDKDAAAAGTLDTRLQYLASALELPKLDAQDIANGLVSVGQEGLRLAFSTLRLTRANPEEQPFIRMLLGTEAGLLDVKEPVVFPVFGRGRALYALVGQGIRRETIDQAATFLIGKCSCQVKEQNPGVDLLLGADWTSLLKAQSAAPPDLPSLAELSASAPVTVTINGNGDVLPQPARSLASGSTPWSGLAVIALGASLATVLVLVLRRK